MRLTGGAAARLKAILPPGTEAFIHLTITDEPPLAQAFVIIEARPRLALVVAAGRAWLFCRQARLEVARLQRKGRSRDIDNRRSIRLSASRYPENS